MKRSRIELKDTRAGYFEDHCASGLFTMRMYLLDHLCDDLEQVNSIQFVYTALFEHLQVVLERL